MAETPHSTYRLSPDTKSKLIDLADLGGTTQAEVINNLIQAEHRYRREEIDKMKAEKQQSTE
jgi:hypothetical protein